MTHNQEILRLIKKDRYSFEDLLSVMAILRSPDGCPWDREQDHHSIRSSLIEETYEVIEAVDNEDSALLQEELGDLLFQIVFHAQIETEREGFGMADVIHDITAKMVHRHPHVFGNIEVENSSQVLQNWEQIKTEEKQRNSLVEKLRAVPPMLPALMRASKVCKKAGQAADVDEAEILGQLQAQLQSMQSVSDAAEKEVQIGNLLMQVTNLSRKWDVDAEHALSKATDRLIDEIDERSKQPN